MKMPINLDDLLKTLGTKESKKLCEKHYNMFIGVIAGISPQHTMSILKEGYKSNKQLCDEGKEVSKKDIGKEGYGLAYCRCVFHKTGEDTEIERINSMKDALSSVKKTSGAWIFIPKEKMENYEIRHLASTDMGGKVAPPKDMKAIASFFAFKEGTDMQKNEIAFDFVPPQDIQYFGVTLESQKDNIDFAAYRSKDGKVDKSIMNYTFSTGLEDSKKTKAKKTEAKKEKAITKTVYVYKNNDYDDSSESTKE